MPKKVVIIGGGIGGMSAAHELVDDRHDTVLFDVHVLERQPRSPGGKARSVYVPDVECPLGPGPEVTHAGRYLPGEHGFRFFPHFYTHLKETMGQIPCGNGAVSDNLVRCKRLRLSCMDADDIVLGLGWFTHPFDFLKGLKGAITRGGVGHREAAFFVGRLYQFLTSCDRRREEEYEGRRWCEYVLPDALERSLPPDRLKAYRRLCVEGCSRALLANDPLRASARTVASTTLQILWSVFNQDESADEVLNGPTSEVFLNPWLEYLTRRCHYRLGAAVEKILWREDGTVRGVLVREGNETTTLEGDYYVFALPVERMAALLMDSPRPDRRAHPPDLANVIQLGRRVAWMNGIQFFLRKDVTLVDGHSLHVDSPWALTSISQAQFWSKCDLGARTEGRVRGVLSVCISRWDNRGLLHEKCASECTAQEIAEEVYEQLRRSFKDSDDPGLTFDNVYSWTLDPDLMNVGARGQQAPRNEEPLFVNETNTLTLRPDAQTSVENLFLAADYVKTYTDVACMEAANEAARRAVNSILKKSRSPAAPCALTPLWEPPLLAPLRWLDQQRYARGKPWKWFPGPWIT